MASLARRAPALAGLVASLVFAAPAAATNWFVSPCGNDAWTGVDPNCIGPHGPKRTIQAAIGAASDGDQISVMPGQYPGGIHAFGKAVHVIGLGGAFATFVDGGGGQRCLVCDDIEGPDTIFEGITFRNGSTSESGGGAYVYFASPTFRNCVFKDCDADEFGGGVAVFIASPTFEQCVFQDNSADVRGGGVYIGTNGFPSFTECTFDDNYAGTGGGLAANSAYPLLDSCQVLNNTALSGGGLAVDNGALTLISCGLFWNDGLTAGGGIRAAESEVSITGGTLSDNTASTHGGGVYLTDSTMTLDSMSFLGNTASDGGGGVSCWDSVVNGDSMVFQDGTSEYGGGMYVWRSTVNLTSLTVANNTADEGGGGIYVVNESAVTFDDIVLSGNSAYIGAAIKTHGSSLHIENADVTSNNAQSSGGIDVNTGTLYVNDVAFDGNTAALAAGGLAILNVDPGDAVVLDSSFVDNVGGLAGGGIWGNQASLRIEDTTFNGNTADYGGAIDFQTPEFGSHLEIRGCDFLSNQATTSGGAVAILEGYFVDIVECDFFANTADNNGGAVYGSSPALRMSNCDVAGNDAAFGGGVYLSDLAAGQIVNTRLSQNAASSLGGGVMLDSGAILQMFNCTSTLNDSWIGGRSLHLSTNTNAEVINSILWNDLGDSIGGIGDVECRYSIVPAAYAGPGCQSTDPLFTNVGGGDFSLQAASPAVDAGSSWLLPTDTPDADGDGNDAEMLDVDHDGEPRVMDGGASCGGGSVDMGAYERPGTVVTVVDADLDGNGVVDATDLLLLLGSWDTDACPIADLNADGIVGLDDLLILLGQWS